MKHAAPILVCVALAATAPSQSSPSVPEIIAVPVEGAESIAVLLGVRAGVFDEPEGWNGAAHLVEHLVLHSPAGDIDDPFVPLSSGGPIGQAFADCNAETMWQGTYFYSLRPAPAADGDTGTRDTADLERTLGVFAAMLHRSTFDAATLATERPRAVSEVRNVAASMADNPQLRWSSERLARMAKAGNEADMAALTLDELAAFKLAHYRPERCVLVVTGAIDGEQVTALARRVFARAAEQAGAAPPPPQLTAKATRDERGTAVHTVPSSSGADSPLATRLAAEVWAKRLRAALKSLRPEAADATEPRQANVWVETPADGSVRVAVALRSPASGSASIDADTSKPYGELHAAALASTMRSLADEPPTDAEVRAACRTITMPLRQQLLQSKLTRLPADAAGHRALAQAGLYRVLAELAGGRGLLGEIEAIEFDAVRAAARRIAEPATAAEPAQRTPARRPNVVVILADDLGYECLTCNGGSSYRTPNLDRLAATGARFTNAHVQPLCTPTRVQVMTGQYNVRNYVGFGFLKPGETTFGNLFRDAGYRTAIAGKWQLGRVAELPKAFGFDEHVLWQHTRMAPRYPNPGLEVQSEQVDYHDGEYGPDLISDFALDFVTRHRDEPFLLYYPMLLPHFPHQATPDSDGWDPKIRGEGKNTDDRWFADMVAYMDKLVGRLVTRLDELGLRDDTLLLFVGDNGTNIQIRSQFGERTIRGMKGRTTVYGTHVPMIANWPGHIAPAVVDDLADSTDVLPTLCDVAGIALPEGRPFDGHSLMPRLEGKGSSPREWIYCWYSPRGEPLREFAYDARFKLYADGQLFDYLADPLEKQPLAADARPKVRDKLQAALQRYAEARPADLEWLGEKRDE